ncbi:hypothetical protein Slin_4423 [Spirosoma linguale DSM 74]|uniref:Uncharacterized protein n=1 Tax=Spirosoma linguale (strain ATCC 33905 / DSM 74 / LMG 10896 / Claus 1) TaxID=504472 RepID=D2QMJ1_SPILD|nr:hypothetical protein Slin_4423 [Spirosoma linguale DSM 74]
MSLRVMIEAIKYVSADLRKLYIGVFTYLVNTRTRVRTGTLTYIPYK